ncbi:MAG: sulfatase-like hydrolase/transferase [Ruthenibacterium sp.]
MKIKKLLTQNAANLLSALLLAFTFCIFGPFEVYMANPTAFPFRMSAVILVAIPVFIVAFLLLCAIGFFVKGKMRLLYTGGVFALGFAVYIQGNYLNADYGTLNGQPIAWENFTSTAIWNTLFWVICLVVCCLAIWSKEKPAKKIMSGICCFFLAIQVVTLGTLGITTNFSRGVEYGITQDGLYEVSSDENIIVFCLDMMDNEYIPSIQKENPAFFEPLDGFIWYENATGKYSTTEYSLPYFLTNRLYLHQTEKSEFWANAYSTTDVYDILHQNNYDVKFYTDRQYIHSEEAANALDNVMEMQTKPKSYWDMGKKYYKYVAFKYAPHLAKKYFWMYSGDLENIKMSAVASDGHKPYSSYEEVEYYKELKKGMTQIENKNAFRFIHVVGAHDPFNISEKVETVKEGSVDYMAQAKGAFEVVFEYIAQMKEMGVYDDATIILLSDHGLYNQTLTMPFMMAKPAGADAVPLAVSKAPVEQGDLWPTILSAATDDTEKYGKSFFEIPEDEARDRLFYLYGLSDSTYNSRKAFDLLEFENKEIESDAVHFMPTGKLYAEDGTIKDPSDYAAYDLGTMQKPDTDAATKKYFDYGITPNVEQYTAYIYGKTAQMSFTLNEVPQQGVKGEFEFTNPDAAYGAQRVIIKCNDTVLCEKTVNNGTPEVLSIAIPKEAIGADGKLKLFLEFPDAKLLRTHCYPDNSTTASVIINSFVLHA